MSEEPMQKLVTLAAFFLVEKKGPQKREKKMTRLVEEKWLAIKQIIWS